MSDLMCVCGKEAKSSSGLTLHQKKCVVFLEAKKGAEKEDKESALEPGGAEDIDNFSKGQGKPRKSASVDIPIGATVLLDGQVFWQSPTDPNGNFIIQTVDKLLVKVMGKEVDEDGVTWLMCKADGGQAVWAIDEGEAKVINFPGDSSNSDSMQEALEDRESDMNEGRDIFGKSLLKYVEARDAKLDSNKLFKKVDKEHRPIIWDHTEKYGKETDTGKGDFQVLDFGYNVHITHQEGKVSTKYDDNAIVEWLIGNDYKDCIKMSPIYEMWDNLKKAGKVPASVISSVEEPTKGKDIFSLTVKKETDK